MSGHQDPAQAPVSHGDDAHSGGIKTPKQLVTVVFLAFVVPIVVILLLVNYVTSAPKPSAGSVSLEEQATAARIQPVGNVSFKDLSAPRVMKTGEQVFQAQCAACHGTGAAGAPKFGDAAAWGPRLGQGFDGLLNSALKGKGAMAAQGGGEHTDYEVARAVVYMANAAGGKLQEPKAPEAPASAASQ